MIVNLQLMELTDNAERAVTKYQQGVITWGTMHKMLSHLKNALAKNSCQTSLEDLEASRKRIIGHIWATLNSDHKVLNGRDKTELCAFIDKITNIQLNSEPREPSQNTRLLPHRTAKKHTLS